MPTEVVVRRTSSLATVIRPRGRFGAVNCREIWEYRDLGRNFAARDIRLRYRQTALGVVWVVLQPLLAAGIFTFVFGRVAHLPSDGVPYLVFALSGLLAWNVFSNVLSRCSSSLTGSAAMVSKVYFPRIVLPLSTVGSTALDFSVALCLQVLLLVVYGVNPGWHVVALPVFLVLNLGLALGAGMIAAALTVRFRDVQYVVPLAVQLLMFASPVAYSGAVVPHSGRWVLGVNPLTGVLEGFRWSLLGRGHLDFTYTIVSALAAVALVVVGSLMFSSMERDFADVI